MAQHAPQPISGTSLTQRILGLGLLLLALVIAAMVAMTARQFHASIQQQADALGETLATHTAQAVAAPLALSDSLALAAVLRELVNNPYVAHAALYSVDNRTLAEAGQRPRSGRINSLYTRSIVFEQVIAGQLHVNIDVQRLQKPLYSGLQGLLLLGVILLLGAVPLLSRLARSASQPLAELQRWLTQPLGPAPHQQRGDEIGLLARTLARHFSLPVVAPPEATQAASSTEEDTPTVEPDTAITADAAITPDRLPEHCAVLAIGLRLEQGIYDLNPEQHEELLDHYSEALEQVAAVYQGRLLELADGQLLMLFHDDNDAYVRHALCAAELLRAFAHTLQMEIADSGATLGMQLGVAWGPAVTDLAEQALLHHPAVAEALELTRHSRNLVLLGQSAAGHPQTACASIRSIARPAGASCVERLLPPWPEQLDEQLQDLLLLMQPEDEQEHGHP